MQFLRKIDRELSRWENLTTRDENTFLIERRLGGYIYALFGEVEAYWSSSKTHAQLFRAERFIKTHSFINAVMSVEVDTPERPRPRIDYAERAYPSLPDDGSLGVELARVDPEFMPGLFQRLAAAKMWDVYGRLLCTVAMHPKLCHLVIDRRILDKGALERMRFRDVLDQALLYTMVVLVHSENTEVKITLRHACVLRIDDARCLPPCSNEPESNPYVPMFKLPDEESGVLKYMRAPAHWRGLYSLEEFKDRFRRFTGGIFEGVNWDKLYACGSVIPACAIRSPLEKRFLSLDDYFDEYYPSKRVVPGIEKLKREERAILEDHLSDIDIVVDEVDDENYDFKVERLANTVRRNLMAAHGLEKLSEEQFAKCRISTGKSYKYYFSGTLLPRSVEVFRFYTRSPTQGVRDFHLPCVRGIYDGQELYLMPSAVCAAFSGVCINFKLVLDTAHASEIILKYYSRGYRTILGSKESRFLERSLQENPEKYASVCSGLRSNARYTSTNNPVFTPRGTGESIYHVLDTSYEYVRARDYNYVEDEEAKKVTPPREAGQLRTPRWSIFG